MKIQIISIVLLFFSVSCLFSQENKRAKLFSDIRKSKNHIDLDIKNIFNGLGNATILYKRSVQMGKLVNVSSINLIRVSAKFNYQNTFTEDPREDYDTNPDVVFFPKEIRNIKLGVGFEKQKMNKNFVHYYGIDAVLHLTNCVDTLSRYDFGGVSNSHYYNARHRDFNIIRAGINPFFGVKYYFTPQISLGIETGLALMYFRQNITEYRYQFEQENGEWILKDTNVHPLQSEGIQAKFNNLRFVTAGYIF